MKAYLLGTLEPERAAALEEDYFVNPTALRRMREVESTLIESYLSGRLARREKQLFERRYLENPALLRRIEEARVTHTARTPARTPFAFWRSLSFAGALALVAVFAVTYRGGPGVPAGAASPGAVDPAPPVTATLQPGVSKGADSGASIVIPSGGRAVRLFLERPGEITPRSWTVDIHRIEENGSRSRVRTSGPTVSIVRSGLTVVPVDIPASELMPGEYAIEVLGPSGQVADGYAVRLTRKP